jgi:hypothetical protein
VLVEADLAVHAVTEAGGAIAAIGSYADRSALLSAAQADYLAFLTQRRSAPTAEPGERVRSAQLVSVPLRLAAFCDEARLRAAARRSLDEALGWETRAVRSARTLTEWALRQALMGSATGELA